MNLLNEIKNMNEKIAEFYGIGCDNAEDFAADDREFDKTDWEKEQQADWDRDRQRNFNQARE